VIDRMVEAGIEVKMVTGDHLNIAKETAKLIGMSTNILPNTV
jgi:H+-transporting ATPase